MVSKRLSVYLSVTVRGLMLRFPEQAGGPNLPCPALTHDIVHFLDINFIINHTHHVIFYPIDRSNPYFILYHAHRLILSFAEASPVM